MARITVEDCLTKETNRFGLVQLASKRTKQILHGAKAQITDPRANKAVVTALREIAAGKVRFMRPEDEAVLQERERERLEHEQRERERHQSVKAQRSSEIAEVMKLDSEFPSSSSGDDEEGHKDGHNGSRNGDGPVGIQ